MTPDFSNVKDVYKGTTPVNAVYLGNVQIWTKFLDWFELSGSELTVKGAYSASQSGSKLTIN